MTRQLAPLPRNQRLMPAVKVAEAIRTLAAQPDVLLFLRRIARLRIAVTSTGVGRSGGSSSSSRYLLERRPRTPLALPRALSADGPRCHRGVSGRAAVWRRRRHGSGSGSCTRSPRRWRKLSPSSALKSFVYIWWQRTY